MSGCTNCAAKSGCSDRKGTMLGFVGDELERLYPTRVWGEPDDEQRFGAGICHHDGEALAEELAQILDASTLYREGGEDEYCDYIDILCVGREPSVAQMRYLGAPIPAEVGAAPLRELYLRVCLSTMSRMAAVMQVAVHLDVEQGDLVVRELPRPGVFDAPLLHRFQRLVATLPAYDIVNVDFGEISAPPPGYAPGDYAELYGGEPHVANYLFFPQPSTMRTQTVLAPAA